MIIKIKATNIELTEELSQWVEEKVGDLKKPLGKFGEDSFDKGKDKIEVWVEIGRTSRHHKKGDIYRAEIQLYLPKKHLRAVSKSIDLRAAVIEARDELDREIRKYKGRRIARARKWARKAKQTARSISFLKRS